MKRSFEPSLGKNVLLRQSLTCQFDFVCGYSNEKTTEIYLKSVDMTTIDNANRNILTQLDTD